MVCACADYRGYEVLDERGAFGMIMTGFLADGGTGITTRHIPSGELSLQPTPAGLLQLKATASFGLPDDVTERFGHVKSDHLPHSLTPQGGFQRAFSVHYSLHADWPDRVSRQIEFRLLTRADGNLVPLTYEFDCDDLKTARRIFAQLGTPGEGGCRS